MERMKEKFREISDGSIKGGRKQDEKREREGGMTRFESTQRPLGGCVGEREHQLDFITEVSLIQKLYIFL